MQFELGNLYKITVILPNEGSKSYVGVYSMRMGVGSQFFFGFKNIAATSDIALYNEKISDELPSRLLLHKEALFNANSILKIVPMETYEKEKQ